MKSSTGLIGFLLSFLLISGSCAREIQTGAERVNLYLPLLADKRVALCVNQTSRIGKVHIVDTLRSLGIDIRLIFAPEHGFRGTADAGEKIKDGRDAKTGIPIVSLYGSKLKPSADDWEQIDLIIFDIQDVGVRFYTYISTLHYLLESCLENRKQFIVLDRPNPHGMQTEGFVLDTAYRSFVGIAPIPVVHGLTLGEYARMAIGEHWISGSDSTFLVVVPCAEYSKSMKWSLAVKSSPNLPNDLAIALYPSLCFFEGTDISVGRGTAYPFQVCGAPALKGKFSFSFTPQSVAGAKEPPHLSVPCYGLDLHLLPVSSAQPFTLQYLLAMYKNYPDKSRFFDRPDFFDKLAGTDRLRKMIGEGKTEAEIRASWATELHEFKNRREKYLLYPF